MSFNPDLSKQAQEVIFSRKINKVCHPPLLFNNSTVQQISSQKHLGIHLDEELTFKHHINKKIKPVRALELFANSTTFFVPLY